MSAIIGVAFGQAHNGTTAIHDNDELRGMNKASEVLDDDDAAPRCHRMKAWILLGNVLGDWDEANDCFKAQSVWQIVRRWHTVGEDESVDASLEELRS